MNTATLDIKRMEAFREILNINDEKLLTNTIAYIRETKQTSMRPPEGFMTGSEFERRVKERVTKFYKANGLLWTKNICLQTEHTNSMVYYL